VVASKKEVAIKKEILENYLNQIKIVAKRKNNFLAIKSFRIRKINKKSQKLKNLKIKNLFYKVIIIIYCTIKSYKNLNIINKMKSFILITNQKIRKKSFLNILMNKI